YCTSAHYLYTLLLHPFEETIKNKTLINVPDGKLNYVPFEALLTDMPDTTGTVQFNKLPYLIHKNSMNYAYSANLLLKLDKQKKQAEHRLLAFAPEYFSDTVKFIDEQLILIPLPGVEREVDMI